MLQELSFYLNLVVL